MKKDESGQERRVEHAVMTRVNKGHPLRGDRQSITETLVMTCKTTLNAGLQPFIFNSIEFLMPDDT
jgi:hypothetical protein